MLLIAYSYDPKVTLTVESASKSIITLPLKAAEKEMDQNYSFRIAKLGSFVRLPPAVPTFRTELL